MSTAFRRPTRRSELHGMTAEQNVRYAALIVLLRLREGRQAWRRGAARAVRDGYERSILAMTEYARAYDLAAKDVRAALREEVL